MEFREEKKGVGSCRVGVLRFGVLRSWIYLSLELSVYLSCDLNVVFNQHCSEPIRRLKFLLILCLHFFIKAPGAWGGCGMGSEWGARREWGLGRGEWEGVGVGMEVKEW